MKNKALFLTVLIGLITLIPSAAFAFNNSIDTLTATPELGQLKVCKIAGDGVLKGQVFTIRVGAKDFDVQAGYCVLAGLFPVDTQVTIEENIPAGYFVSDLDVLPSARAVSTDKEKGIIIVEIGSGVTEAVFTNNAEVIPTPTNTPGCSPDCTPTPTPTLQPTRTPSPTPDCAPGCTPTPTPMPRGRMQICKQADGEGVSGIFTFRYLTRAKDVPVGFCSPMNSIDAGTLTVTEDAREGIVLSDIYTIPADRLISKDISKRSATVTIVPGNSATQTIIVFVNRSMDNRTVTPTVTPTPDKTLTMTPTPTNTLTVTPTATSSVCQPKVVTADFSQISVGSSVEGLGVVAPDLNIDAIGAAVKVSEAVPPTAYGAPNGNIVVNGGLAPGGGFSDTTAQSARQAHQYNFTFAPGVSVSNFSLHMLDYGDWNPSLNTSHNVSLTAYDGNGGMVAQQVISYSTLAAELPRSSSLFGDLWITGDAVTASPGQPGNWTWNVSGSGIVRVVLAFGEGYDPAIAFDTLTYYPQCP